MTWLTWRQHRGAALVAAVSLAAAGLGVVLLILLYPPVHPNGAMRCTTSGSSSSCLSLQPQLGDSAWSWISVVGLLLPVLVGTFVGATTISRELEGQSHLVAWAQGLTRRQWFIRRAILLGAGAVLVGVLYAAITQGWFAAQRASGDPIWDGFDIGPVLIAYTLFALALGMAVGALLRRTTPASGFTLVAYIAVRVSIALTARPRYLPPATAVSVVSTNPTGTSMTGSGAPVIPAGGWTVGSPVDIDASGHIITSSHFCFQLPPVPTGCYPAPITILQTYQPAARFWPFQGIEAAIFVVLALALFALAYRLAMRSQ